MHIPLTNNHFLVAQQEPYKRNSLNEISEEFSGGAEREKGGWGAKNGQNDKTEMANGHGRRAMPIAKTLRTTGSSVNQFSDVLDNRMV